MSHQPPVWFRRFEGATRRVNKLFVGAASLCTVLIVSLVLLSVASRLGGWHILWPTDITQFALVYLVFLGMGPALESGHHVAVELFDRLVPRAIRRFVPYIATISTIIFGAIFLYYLWRVTSRVFADSRLAVAAITVPLKWVYIVGPIGMLQFILTAFAELGRVHWRMSDPARQALGH